MSFWQSLDSYMNWLVVKITAVDARTMATYILRSIAASLAAAVISFIPMALFAKFIGSETPLSTLFAIIFASSALMRLFMMLLHMRLVASVKATAKNYLLTIWTFTTILSFIAPGARFSEIAQVFEITVLMLSPLLGMIILVLVAWRLIQATLPNRRLAL